MSDNAGQGASRHFHLPELQSLRGLAALVVACHHCTFYYATSARFHAISEAVFNGHAMVVFFFVLSGFVLTRSLIAKPLGGATLWSFYVRRVFRIYPALWFAIILIGVYEMLVRYLGLPPGMSPVIHANYAPPGGMPEYSKMVVGLGAKVLPPLWSIRVELFASALIPILAMLARRGLFMVSAVTAFLVGVAVVVATLHRTEFSYFFCFGLGAILCPLLGKQRKPLPRGAGAAMAPIVLIMWSVRWLSPAWRFDIDYHAVVPSLIEASMAATLIWFVIRAGDAVQWLQHPSLVWLGEISYSLYLLHYAVMGLVALALGQIAVVDALPNDVRTAILILLVLGITLPASALVYRTVEMAGIAAGRRAAELRRRVSAN